jgi:hypothetical protein
MRNSGYNRYQGAGHEGKSLAPRSKSLASSNRQTLDKQLHTYAVNTPSVKQRSIDGKAHTVV